MATDGKDGKTDIAPIAGKEPNKTPLAEDLDRNPIQYATHEPGKMTTEPHDKPYMELTLRSGNHGELMQKLLRQRIETRAKEFPRWPSDAAAGVRLMWIESRFWYDRERLGPDFDADWRKYRAKYLHSLELDPREPVASPDYERELINPIRRFYMRGGDWFEKNVVRKFIPNEHRSAAIRTALSRLFMCYLASIAGYYYIRYHNSNWESKQGCMIMKSAPIMYPSHPKFPFKEYKTEPAHHFDMGFLRRNAYKDLRNYEDKSTVL